MRPYTYVLVRKDLAPEQIAVQACHAALQAGFAFEEPADISSLVLLEVADEAALQEAAQRLDKHRLEHRLFYEPDFGPMGYSALATRPVTSKAHRRLFAGYKMLQFVPAMPREPMGPTDLQRTAVALAA